MSTSYLSFGDAFRNACLANIKEHKKANAGSLVPSLLKSKLTPMYENRIVEDSIGELFRFFDMMQNPDVLGQILQALSHILKATSPVINLADVNCPAPLVRAGNLHQAVAMYCDHLDYLYGIARRPDDKSPVTKLAINLDVAKHVSDLRDETSNIPTPGFTIQDAITHLKNNAKELDVWYRFMCTQVTCVSFFPMKSKEEYKDCFKELLSGCSPYSVYQIIDYCEQLHLHLARTNLPVINSPRHRARNF